MAWLLSYRDHIILVASTCILLIYARLDYQITLITIQ